MSIVGSFGVLLANAPVHAQEQATTLPTIVVTSPSPIVTRRAQPRPVPPVVRAAAPVVPRRRASQQPRVAPPPQAQPVEPPVQQDQAATFPVGILPVVTDTFSPVTVVSREELAREQPKTLGDALFDKPGISASTYAPGAASRPIIRGLDNYRVRIQENGIGVHDVSALGEDHAVPINPLVQDRIEVIRGPATLRYGSQAIGGVVSAENNRVPTFIPRNGISGQVLGGFSSVDNGGVGAVTLDAGGGNVAVHADGLTTKTDSYYTPYGRQLNSATESQGGAVGLSYIFDQGFVGISFSHYDALYQIPGFESAQSRTRLDPTQDKVLAKGEYRFESGPFEALRFWIGGSTYKHNEIGIGEDGIDGVQATFKNREAEGRIELQHVPVAIGLGTLTGAFGIQATRSKLGTSGEAGGLLDPTDTRSAAGYLFEQLALGNGFKLQAAGRIEQSRPEGTASFFPSTYLPNFTITPGIDPVTGDPVDVLTPEDPEQRKRRRDFTPKSVSLGALQELPFGLVASLNGQYVERAPAAPELYSKGPHDATATFEIGNPDLKLERARTVEIGLRRAEGPFRLDATGYYTRYTGFIYKRDTGVRCGDTFSTCGSDDELRQIVYSQQNATFYGAEIGAQFDAVPFGGGFFGLDAQYDFVRARFDDGTYVPRIPPHRVGGGFYWRDPGAGWFARVGLLHAFDHTETAPNETFTPGYNLLRAELSYTQRLDRKVHGFSDFTLGIRGDNLLDDDVRNSASFKKDEILLPGRNVRMFLSARF